MQDMQKLNELTSQRMTDFINHQHRSFKQSTIEPLEKQTGAALQTALTELKSSNPTTNFIDNLPPNQTFMQDDDFQQ